MSNIRDFRLKIDQEKRQLVKLERRALAINDRVHKQRGMIDKMEKHLKEWAASLGGEHHVRRTT